MMKRSLRRWSWGALALVTLVGCAVNPVTGRRQLALVSESQEIQMGRQGAAEVEQMLGLVPDSALQMYVRRIGGELAARSERPGLPWHFGVVDDPTPNAFALPGGFIYLTRGMMNLMDSEAELAAVLGHEIGHVTARHSVTQISRAQLAQLGFGVGSIFLPQLQQLGGLAGGVLQVVFSGYSRDAERQADELGFRYAMEQGYDVREMADVFESLQRIGDAEGRSPVPSWLATHPAPAERIEAVRARIAGMPVQQGARLGGQTYMSMIDGMVYGENPRQGFFEGGVFHHPELRFRMAFPRDWRTQNTTQAVMAGSPQRDAAIQLTLAQGSAQQAAQRFASQQGLAVGGSSRETINGIPGLVLQFQAQTQQGVIQGLAAFLEHEGRTYQILTYAPAQRYGAYDRLFRQVIGSFARETSPQVLARQPDRLRVVTLDRAMTLAEFNRRYPSAIPLPELAIINQVANESATLPAGALAKRVVGGTGS